MDVRIKLTRAWCTKRGKTGQKLNEEVKACGDWREKKKRYTLSTSAMQLAHERIEGERVWWWGLDCLMDRCGVGWTKCWCRERGREWWRDVGLDRILREAARREFIAIITLDGLTEAVLHTQCLCPLCVKMCVCASLFENEEKTLIDTYNMHTVWTLVLCFFRFRLD